MKKPNTNPIRKSKLNVINLLRKEFIRRKNKNSGYSLSAFAKNLQIDQSLFSKILLGKKKISDDFAADLLLRAGISPRKANAALSGFEEIDESEFTFLSNWIPFAILELAKTKSFRPDVKSISNRLQVHAEEVRFAIQLLERFGYLHLDSANSTFEVRKPNNSWANTKRTSEGRRSLQKKYCEMSLEALEQVPFEKRDHGSLTVAINLSRLPDLKEKMNKFRLELSQWLEMDDELDEVFQITMSVFPISNPLT